jgi:hypothetical protein
MRRIAIAFGLALASAFAACGGHDEAQRAARKAREATQVTVESAQHPGASTSHVSKEDTEVTVDSAETGKKPAGE